MRSVTVNVSNVAVGPGRYRCASGACVADTYGDYTTASCSGTCTGSGPAPVDTKADGQDAPPPYDANANYTISWNAVGAQVCNAFGSWNGSKAVPSGTQSFANMVRGVYNYFIGCSNENGSNSDWVTVNVIQVPRCTFTVNPTTVVLPQAATLTWACTYADPPTCAIDQGVGPVSNVGGDKPVTPQQTTTYILTCTGLDGTRSFPVTANVFTPGLIEVRPQ